MNTANNQKWSWSDLDPMTRCVVAAFSWRIGDVAQGDISRDGFVGAMAETFPRTTTEDVIKTVEWTGPEGTRNAIVNMLVGSEVEVIGLLTLNLGQLAGGSEATVSLATLTGQQLQRTSGMYDAIPALCVLSEMATARLFVE